MREGDEWEDEGKEGERQQGKGNWSENEGGKMEGWQHGKEVGSNGAKKGVGIYRLC